MRRAFVRCIVSAFAAFAAGCSIHPLPEDVAPLDTVEIVDHIRCEMYDALRNQVALMFEDSGPRAAAIGARIREERATHLEEFKRFIPLLTSDYQKRTLAFAGTTIGYGFRFEITEQDVAKAEANFGLPWNALSAFSLKATGGLDKARTNTRRFFKIETFEELTYSDDCLTKDVRPPNIVYPITGEIGLRPVVHDFVQLTTRGARTDPADAKDIKSFSERLTFTTVISGGLSPKVKLAPITDKFRLADVGGDLSASRKDIHELTLTFAISKDFDARSVRAAAPDRRNAVIEELRTLRILDAVERGGGGVITTP